MWLKAANSDTTILLLGESGTGKSVLARAIHQRSPRSDEAFVTVSCPSLSRELLESEAFRPCPGPLQALIRIRRARSRQRTEGLCFWTRSASCLWKSSRSWLRLLQEREYERVGESKPRRANVRIISATNRDLVRRGEGRASFVRICLLPAERDFAAAPAHAGAGAGHQAAGALCICGFRVPCRKEGGGFFPGGIR